MTSVCQSIPATFKKSRNSLPNAPGQCFLQWTPKGTGGEWTTAPAPGEGYIRKGNVEIRQIQHDSFTVQDGPFRVRYPYFFVRQNDPNAEVYVYESRTAPAATEPIITASVGAGGGGTAATLLTRDPEIEQYVANQTARDARFEASLKAQPERRVKPYAQLNLSKVRDQAVQYEKRIKEMGLMGEEDTLSRTFENDMKRVKALAREYEAIIIHESRVRKAGMTVSEQILGKGRNSILSLKDMNVRRASRRPMLSHTFVPRPPPGFSSAASTLTTPEQIRALGHVETIEETFDGENPMHAAARDTIMYVRAQHTRSYRVQLVCFVALIASIMSVFMFGMLAMAFSNSVQPQQQEQQTEIVPFTPSNARAIAAAQGSFEVMTDFSTDLHGAILSDPNLWMKSDDEVLRTVRETWCPALQTVLGGLSVFERTRSGDDHDFYSMLATICLTDVSEEEAAQLARDITGGFNCVLYNQYEGSFGVTDRCPAPVFVQSAVDASNSMLGLSRFAGFDLKSAATNVGAILLTGAAGLIFSAVTGSSGPPLEFIQFGRRRNKNGKTSNKKKNGSRHARR